MSSRERPTEGQDQERLLPALSRTDEVARALGAAAQVLGPILGDAVRGFVTLRRLGRLEDATKVFEDEFLDFESEVVREYVRTEEFEDLAIETFERVMRERNADKRHHYGKLLAGMAEQTVEPYDVKLDALRAMEQLQPVHVRILRALQVRREPDANAIAGSRLATLQNALGGSDRDEILALLQRLADLRLIVEGAMPWTGNVTGAGAADLQSMVTPFGRVFMKFLRSGH